MKNISIKLKITLWFAVWMLVLTAIVFLFFTGVSRSDHSQQLRDTLVNLVNQNTNEVRYDNGELIVGGDFVSYKDGVYCLVFLKNGQKYSGYAPYEELEKESLEDGRLRSVVVNGEHYLLYDRKTTDKRRVIWVRGIVSENGNLIISSSMYHAVLVSLPLLILLAAAGAYLIARRSFYPIQKISRTAEEIGRSGNLSNRIPMNKNGDELHRLAGTFNLMFERLETSFEAERQFTSDASHELRTPVAIILAQCEYAFENASSADELYEIIGKIQKQGYRMQHLIESLLYFVRLEQQTGQSDFEITDLSGLVSSICREQKDLTEKNIVLLTEIQPDIRMRADTALFHRMLENLISNAYRYGKENGIIQVSLMRTDYGISLVVADDGIGIAAEELPKIWKRFYRVDKTRSYKKNSGLGLGLAMVKQIAKLHDGTIEVESEQGKGSVFTITFKKNMEL